MKIVLHQFFFLGCTTLSLNTPVQEESLLGKALKNREELNGYAALMDGKADQRNLVSAYAKSGSPYIRAPRTAIKNEVVIMSPECKSNLLD
jgi:hypothetical protein